IRVGEKTGILQGERKVLTIAVSFENVQENTEIPLLKTKAEKQKRGARIAETAGQIRRQGGRVFRHVDQEIQQIAFRQHQRIQIREAPEQVVHQRPLRCYAEQRRGLLLTK